MTPIVQVGTPRQPAPWACDLCNCPVLTRTPSCFKALSIVILKFFIFEQGVPCFPFVLGKRLGRAPGAREPYHV